MNAFFLVLARDEKHVSKKIKELESFGFPYIIVCGTPINHPNVIYRRPMGKYDAINFGARFIPQEFEIIALNDVDTEISNVELALKTFVLNNLDLLFARVKVRGGPQQSFYSLLDSLRRRLPIAASGELMLVRRDVLNDILPLKPCKAEDTYILFEILRQKRPYAFCSECFVVTERTNYAQDEEAYKRRTVGGIYQALKYATPSQEVRLFYLLLPLISPLLLFYGRKGYFWSKGILLGLVDYLRGDYAGKWAPEYVK